MSDLSRRLGRAERSILPQGQRVGFILIGEGEDGEAMVAEYKARNPAPDRVLYIMDLSGAA